LEESIIYEAPQYAVFSNLLSLHLSWVQIFSLAPCSQTPLVYSIYSFRKAVGIGIILPIFTFSGNIVPLKTTPSWFLVAPYDQQYQNGSCADK
jgi:hypothetical protein